MPRNVVESVVKSVCGRDVDGLVAVTSGGLNETYRAELHTGPVVVRIARRPEPWFVDEAHLISRAREVGVRGPEVLGVEHIEHDGELLSFSILELLPGRALSELAGELDTNTLQSLVVRSGEMLARLHSLDTDRGIRQMLQPRAEALIARAEETVRQTASAEQAGLVRRGDERIRALLSDGTPHVAFTHGDFLPKHIFVDDGELIGLIDWEFAGSASPAYDLARWELSAPAPFCDWSHLLRQGYAEVADPDVFGDWAPAFAID